MPYIECITKAGKTIEIERYYTARYGKKGQKRADHKKPTKEEQKKVNTRLAEKKLRRIMNANFDGNDYHVVLPYIRKTGSAVRTKEEMREDIDKFLRQLRKAYRAEGKELKYVHVMEIGAKGARHHHLVINHIDTAAIMQAWPHSRAQVFPLDESGQYAKLAAYLIKYTDKHMEGDDSLQGKRWSSSRNLVRPQPEVRVISHRSWFRSEPGIPHKFQDKFYIDADSVRKGIHGFEFGGYGYLAYTLVRIPKDSSGSSRGTREKNKRYEEE